MATLENRLIALERYIGKDESKLAGCIDLLPVQEPIDALAGAGVGLWLLVAAGTDEGFLGEVRRDGTREIHCGNA